MTTPADRQIEQVALVPLTRTAATLPELADQANREHDLCVAATSTALDHAHAAGQALIEAKGRLPHGAFGPWLAENFRGSARSARAYMRVAEHWPAIERKRQRVAVFAYRDALKLLAAPKPEPQAQPPGNTPITLADVAQEIQRYQEDLVRRQKAIHQKIIDAIANTTDIRKLVGGFSVPKPIMLARQRWERDLCRFECYCRRIVALAERRIEQLTQRGGPTA